MDKLTFSIKNGAMNGDKARTCIQRRDLAGYGFDCGESYVVVENYTYNALEFRANPDQFERLGNVIDGASDIRKVSCVHDKRRGYTYQTIDYRYSKEARVKLFGNAERLTVTVIDGAIIIRAELAA